MSLRNKIFYKFSGKKGPSPSSYSDDKLPDSAEKKMWQKLAVT